MGLLSYYGGWKNNWGIEFAQNKHHLLFDIKRSIFDKMIKVKTNGNG